ncbi:DUF1330 domain-containing protein [Gordonia sp. CPCC 206044]|uniref:DUF1330 domain-containing protein n=1 Tax=Gordonia sp. CPCC 206044 TaxID=3140793 RepID=UPI003AF3A671
MSITCAVLLWSVDGRDAQLHSYEDDVLRLVAEHRGRIVSRVRRVDTDSDDPSETQIIEFADESAFDAYMSDPRRVAMADRRDACISRTRLWRVETA